MNIGDYNNKKEIRKKKRNCEYKERNTYYFFNVEISVVMLILCYFLSHFFKNNVYLALGRIILYKKCTL